jgi:hypothetical protein
MQEITEQHLIAAMDYLAENDHTLPEMIALDQKLADGGRLTNDEVRKVLAIARWRNMDKGN